MPRKSHAFPQWPKMVGPERRDEALHKFNPIRLQLLRDNIAAHLGRDANQLDVLKDVEIIDIGCGAGLLSEPLARMGAK